MPRETPKANMLTPPPQIPMTLNHAAGMINFSAKVHAVAMNLLILSLRRKGLLDRDDLEWFRETFAGMIGPHAESGDPVLEWFQDEILNLYLADLRGPPPNVG